MANSAVANSLTALTAQLRWFEFVSSRRRTDDLDRVVRRVEGSACQLGGLAVTEGHGGQPSDANGRVLLARLRRADEALRAVAGQRAAVGEEPAPAAVPARTAARVDEPLLPVGGNQTAPKVDEVLPRAALDLIALRDEALLAADSEHTTAKQVADRFSRKIGEILETDGITPAAPSEVLDPKRQHVIGTRPTDDAALHGKIAEVVGPGYLFHGRVVRPEQVVTWRKTRSAASAGT